MCTFIDVFLLYKISLSFEAVVGLLLMLRVEVTLSFDLQIQDTNFFVIAIF